MLSSWYARPDKITRLQVVKIVPNADGVGQE